jgi:hypothetical protein
MASVREHSSAPMSCQEDGNICGISSLSTRGIAVPALVSTQDLAGQVIIKPWDDILRRSASQEEQEKHPASRPGKIVAVLVRGPPQAEPGSSCHDLVKDRCLLGVPPPPDIAIRNLGIDNYQREVTVRISHKAILASPHQHPCPDISPRQALDSINHPG